MQHWCLNVIRTDRGKVRRTGPLLAALTCCLITGSTLLFGTLASAQPSGLFGDSRPAFLDVDEAFQYYTSLDASDRVSIHWTVAPEYYLYQDKFDFSLIAPDGDTRELTVMMPPGTHHHDEFFGDVEVYYNTLTTAIDLPAGLNIDDHLLQIRYQGCAEAGLCYPPQTRLLEITP